MGAHASTTRWLLPVLQLLFALGLARAEVAYAQGTSADPEYLPDTPVDPAERDKQAQAEFQKGKTAYENGEYREAWGHFHDAYALSNRPELLYNIGQTADRLRMDADALKAFKLYLQQLPQAENKREVENRVRALEERIRATGDGSGAEGETDAAVLDLPAPDGDQPPAPPPAQQPRRQGWYFRGGLGFGVRRDAISGGGTDATLAGGGLSGELAAGITLLPGLTVGGGVFFDATSSPTVSEQNAESERASAMLWMIGPMADWYVRHELDGWHLQAALALALANYSRGDSVATGGTGAATGDGAGAGLLLGGGYEWTLSQEWAIGVLGRIAFASVSEDTFSHGIFAPSVLASLTWY